MRHLAKGIPVYYNRKELHVDVEVWGRKPGSNDTYIIQYKGRRITPYEQRLRGWEFTLNGLFKLTYSFQLSELIPASNPFMRLIAKDTTQGSLYHQPVVLGLEHGVTFKEKE